MIVIYFFFAFFFVCFTIGHRFGRMIVAASSASSCRENTNTRQRAAAKKQRRRVSSTIPMVRARVFAGYTLRRFRYLVNEKTIDSLIQLAGISRTYPETERARARSNKHSASSSARNAVHLCARVYVYGRSDRKCMYTARRIEEIYANANSPIRVTYARSYSRLFTRERDRERTGGPVCLCKMLIDALLHIDARDLFVVATYCELRDRMSWRTREKNTHTHVTWPTTQSLH